MSDELNDSSTNDDFQAGRMPAGGVVAHHTWPRSAWLPLGA